MPKVPVTVKCGDSGKTEAPVIRAKEARGITDKVRTIGAEILDGINQAIQECALGGGNVVVVVAPGEVVGMVADTLTAAGYQLSETHVGDQEAFVIEW